MLKVTDDAITNDSEWIVRGSTKVRLVNATPNLDETVAYVARVSSKAQENPSVAGLLRYCAKHGHWSVFEQGAVTVEVVTPLAISVQALRHRSFCFQQFSGRYQDHTAMSEVTDGLGCTMLNMFYMPQAARLQDGKNRQNSIRSDDEALTAAMRDDFRMAYETAVACYTSLIDKGIAKELARFVLPQGVYTRLYVTGNPRSFIHYCNVRGEEGVVQHEHIEMADAVRSAFAQACPTIAGSIWGADA
jgi:thymidylate synthase (FAD)